MTKSIDNTVITQMNAEQASPVMLVRIDTSAVLYFATSKSNVTFPSGGGGDTYTAKAIAFDGYSQDVSGNLQRIKLRLDNVAKDMAGYAVSYDFQGANLNIKRVYRDALGSADYYDEWFNGPIESFEFDYHWMHIVARDGAPLSRRCPKRIYQRLCPWTYGGTECNRDGYTDITSAPLKATGTADSGSTTTLVDNALTQASDFWNYGTITCTKSGTTESRIVYDFDAASDEVSWSIPMSFAVDNTTTYVLTAGCNKTTAWCRNNGAHTSNNINNYGGFPSIGKRSLASHGGFQSQIETTWNQDYWTDFQDFDLSQWN